MRRLWAIVATLLASVGALTACQGPEPLELGAHTVIIDVRTAEEFASGHLEGALNIDVQSSDFAEQIMALDKEGDYIVYCRSGNRSGQAIAQMAQLGFSDMVNGGSVQEASDATGIEIVTN